MTKQKGQSAVEFAFIVPFLIFIFLGLIYGGILFMDYLQYNNAARAIAREVAFTVRESETTDLPALETSLKTSLSTRYLDPIKDSKDTPLYTPTLDISLQTEVDENNTVKKVTGVNVVISLVREENLKLFSILTGTDKEADDEDRIEFPPKELKVINYTMPIEAKND